MSDLAIRVDSLSKAYRIGLREEIPDTLLGAAKGVLSAPWRNWRRLRRLSTYGAGGANGGVDSCQLTVDSPPSLPTVNCQLSTATDEPDTIWALKDVSFDVREGEVVGVIGRNGAGKSTLLKILSRITEPTRGRAELRGRVSSLLEVGTGFHQELTGRENVYMNGTILGMTKREIDRKFDEIVDFSGVEKFLDTPVKRYSSGMKVRLAFAVAAHLEPEILIIDEVLAVGDAEFQRKCLGKMQDVARGGRTVLFVSHNMTAVRSLCRSAISLFQGQVVERGPTSEVVDRYLGTFATGRDEQSWDSPDDAPGNERIRMKRVAIRALECDRPGLFPIDAAMRVSIDFWGLQSGCYSISMHVVRNDSETAFASASPRMSLDRELAHYECEIPPHLLNDGVHKIMVMIVENGRSLFTLDNALRFEAIEPQRAGAWLDRWPGAVRPRLHWNVQLLGGLQ